MPFVMLFIRVAAGKNGVVAHSPHYVVAAAASAVTVVVVVIVVVVAVVVVVVILLPDRTRPPAARCSLESTNRNHWTNSGWLDLGLRPVTETLQPLTLLLLESLTP